MQARLSAIVAVAVVALAAPAEATPAQELERARELFRAGKFDDALRSLNYLLYPTPRLAQADDLVEAHVLLGVSAYETGDQKTARREFEEALFLDPTIVLDKLLFSENAIEYFESIRAEIEEREARDAETRRLAEELERLRQMVVLEKRPYYINYIPFGAGQFQNGKRGKGLFFAASQGVTGGVSAGIWLYLVGEYGLPGKVPPEDARTARRLQQIEIGAGVVCLGLMAWGIVDSLLDYEPYVRGRADKSLLDLPRPSAMLLPDGGGLSFTWEY